MHKARFQVFNLAIFCNLLASYICIENNVISVLSAGYTVVRLTLWLASLVSQTLNYISTPEIKGLVYLVLLSCTVL